MKKKNSTRLAKKPAVNPAVELAKEGGKKKKDVSIELQFQAYEGVLKDLSKENSELRKELEIRKRKGRQDSFSSSTINTESRKKKTPVSSDSTLRKGNPVSSSPLNATTATDAQSPGGRESTTKNLQELIAEAVAKALQQQSQATKSGAASPTRALFSEEKEKSTLPQQQIVVRQGCVDK